MKTTELTVLEPDHVLLMVGVLKASLPYFGITQDNCFRFSFTGETSFKCPLLLMLGMALSDVIKKHGRCHKLVKCVQISPFMNLTIFGAE